MWTYSGFFVEKIDERMVVYASDPEELKIFVDGNGELYPDIKALMRKQTKENGLYQCVIGYGSMSSPLVYSCKRIASVRWTDPEAPVKAGTLRDEIDMTLLHREIEKVFK